MSMVYFRDLGRRPYLDVWHAMMSFTDDRTNATIDEIWFVEHDPVFTLGQSRQPAPRLLNDNIPIVKSDRGGLITYHGPGQIVGYFLCDLQRLSLSVHQFVASIENAMIAFLHRHAIIAERLSGHPGVYVAHKKIGSLGLRIRRGCSYHGLALNIDMDLSPFASIDPCGITGMQVTQLSDFCAIDCQQAKSQLLDQIAKEFNFEIEPSTSDNLDFFAAEAS